MRFYAVAFYREPTAGLDSETPLGPHIIMIVRPMAHTFRVGTEVTRLSTKMLTTAEQFWAMPEPLDKRIELVNGHVVELLALTAQQGLIVSYVLGREPDSVRMTHASYIS